MDGLDLLRWQIALQIAWGADEVLLNTPQDRRQATRSTPALRDTSPTPRPTIRALAGGGLAGPAAAAKIATACNTLQALQAALNDFQACALRDTATQLVFADGAEQTNVMFIGEAPGAEEDRVGRPFVGPAGKLLDRMLGSIGLDRGLVRIANVVPWRPPGNRAPTDSEIAICLPFLQRQIALIQPACLVLLGGTAAKALLPGPERNSGIRRLRGHWRSLEIPGLEVKIPVLPTYHPAYLLRTPSAKREAWLDLLALRKRLNGMV